MKSKSFLTVLLAVLLCATTVSAETLTANGEILPPPISGTKVSDLVLDIIKSQGVTTYTDTMQGWQLISPASFSFNADSSVTVQVSTPATANLTKGTDTVTLSLTCRASQTAAPNTKTEGVDCGTSQMTSSTGALYLSLIPTQATFSTATQGTYTGTVVVSVNY